MPLVYSYIVYICILLAGVHANIAVHNAKVSSINGTTVIIVEKLPSTFVDDGVLAGIIAESSPNVIFLPSTEPTTTATDDPTTPEPDSTAASTSDITGDPLQSTTTPVPDEVTTAAPAETTEAPTTTSSYSPETTIGITTAEPTSTTTTTTTASTSGTSTTHIIPEEGTEDAGTLEAIENWRRKVLGILTQSSNEGRTGLSNILPELEVLRRPSSFRNQLYQSPPRPIPSGLDRGKQRIRQTLHVLIDAASSALERIEDLSSNRFEPTIPSYMSGFEITDDIISSPATTSSPSTTSSPGVTSSPPTAGSPGVTSSPTTSSPDIPSSTEITSPPDVSSSSVDFTTSMHPLQGTTTTPSSTIDSTEAPTTVQQPPLPGIQLSDEPQDCKFWVRSGHCHCKNANCTNWNIYVRKACEKHCENENDSMFRARQTSTLRKCRLLARQLTVAPCDVTTDYLPHPLHCECFYQCEGGRKRLRACPSGLHFDQRYGTNVCIQPQNAGCPSS